MSWGAVAGAAIGVVGGALGGSDGGQQVQEKKLDPNLQRYLYGESGQGGLLGAATGLQQQQTAQGGLNPYQNAGLEMQRQTLLSPAWTQGADMKRQAGAALLQGGAAGNPFSSGLVAGNGRVQMPQFNNAQIQQTLQQLPGVSLDQGRQLASDRFGINPTQYNMATIGQRPTTPQQSYYGASSAPIPQTQQAMPQQDNQQAELEAYIQRLLREQGAGQVAADPMLGLGG